MHNDHFTMIAITIAIIITTSANKYYFIKIVSGKNISRMEFSSSSIRGIPPLGIMKPLKPRRVWKKKDHIRTNVEYFFNQNNIFFLFGNKFADMSQEVSLTFITIIPAWENFHRLSNLKPLSSIVPCDVWWVSLNYITDIY